MCVRKICKGLDENLGNNLFVNFGRVKLVEFKDSKVGLKVICVVVNLVLSVEVKMKGALCAMA